MASTLHLEVLTPAGSIFKEEVREVVVPTTGGDLGILPQHAPLTAVARLGAMTIKFKEGSKESAHVVVANGILQVEDNQVRVMVDEAVKVSATDDASIKKEVEAVRARMQASQEEIDAANAKLDREAAAMKAQAAQLGPNK